MSFDTDTTESPQNQISQLEKQVASLKRELRSTQSLLDKVSITVETKTVLETMYAKVSAQQTAYTNILLENCPNIILLFDDLGRFVLSTKKFLDVTGTHNFDMLKNRTYEEVFAQYMPPHLFELFQSTFQRVIRAKEIHTLNEWINFNPKTQWRFYTIELTPIHEHPKQKEHIATGVLAVFVDMTDIMQEKQRAEAANNAKSDFLATMSHEIRTPMNAIIGMAEMLSRSQLAPQQEKYLADIQTSSQALLTIVNDILDFSKIEAGKFEIVNTPFSLYHLLDHLSDMFNLLFEQKHLALSFHVQENVPDRLYGDDNRIRQILTNLLSNALKYTEHGGVSFSLTLTPDDMLRFDIQDTGIGIRQEDIPKLFQPFEQFDAKKNKHIMGTGLGLAISYRLCQIMNGALWCESEYGQGSTFSLTLPYVLSTATHEKPVETIPDIFSAPEANVLVVDDISINLAVAEALLGVFDIHPTLVTTGKEALKLVKENAYHIIFMDHMMPGMDGVETTNLIRLYGGRLQDIPIIALTANTVNDAKTMFLQNQFTDFLAKPLDISDLNRCLRQWLPLTILHDKIG
ncbi:MAG: response regulator [Peptococcaceae bacterium]|nr:response regulator [Peptococcaceae bacterium]